MGEKDLYLAIGTRWCNSFVGISRTFVGETLQADPSQVVFFQAVQVRTGGELMDGTKTVIVKVTKKNVAPITRNTTRWEQREIEYHPPVKN